MIRRLLAVSVLVFASLLVSATPAGAANGNILCLYNKQLLPFGFCIGLPR